MRSEREMYQLILGYAQQDPRVRGVILNGSRANPTAKLDQFRDYDIVYLVTDVAPFKEGDISPAFGEVLVMQRTDENQLFHEHFPRLAIYLMQFADGNRIDLTIAPVEDYRPYCFDDKLSVVLTVVLAFIIFHETVSWKSIVGCVLIGAGTLFMVMK